MVENKIQPLLDKYINNPTDPNANFWLAWEYEKIGQNASALSYYLRCAELSNDSDLVYESLIKTWLVVHRSTRRPYYEHQQLLNAITHDPKRPEAYYFLSKIHGDKKEWKEAYYYSSVALKICDLDSKPLLTDIDYPGDYILTFQKAFTSWYVGQREEAKQLWGELFYYDTLPHHKEIIKNNIKNFGIDLNNFTKWHEPLPYTFNNDYKNLKHKFPGSSFIDKNFSQCYQDLFVLTALEGKRGGVYLEVGAGDPFYGNNTALLRKLGWGGTSIDISESFVKLWNEQRSDSVILNTDAKEFSFESLKLGYIDYLQLDIDPPNNTFKVLENIPFDIIEFGVITYEHDYYADPTKSYRKKSREILTKNGYILVAGNISPDSNSPYEDWWVHPNHVNMDVINNMIDSNEEVLFARDYMFEYL